MAASYGRPMVNIGECERVVMEDCRVSQADFCGLGLGRSRHCTVRRCDLSYNGNTGLGMGVASARVRMPSPGCR